MTERPQRASAIGDRMFWISLAVTAALLVVAMSTLVGQDYLARRDDFRSEAQVRARIIGENASAALIFGDAPAAADLLLALRTSPDVVAAGIYRNGKLFAAYSRAGAVARVPASVPAHARQFEDGMLEVLETVVVNGEPVGTVLIQSDTVRLTSALQRYGLSAITLLCFVLVSAYILLARTRRDVATAEKHLEHLAHHDPLTGLPNRSGLADLLKRTVAHATRTRQRAALLFIDLDDFKLVNDSLGHHAGDKLLQEVAGRMAERLRVRDVLSRLGGDEFTVLLDPVESPEQASAVARAIVGELSRPFSIEGQEVFVGASVGISMFPEDAQTAVDMIRNADTAMYRAKQSGKKRFAFFTAEMDVAQQQRFVIENGLRAALQGGGLYLVYQSQVDLRSGELVGLEALLRWSHAEFGKLGPAVFLNVAESSDLIERIGEWVLGEACGQAQRWVASGIVVPPVAVNVSMRQLRNPEFVSRSKAVIANSGLDPSLLELEVTESALMDNPAAAAEQLAQLRAIGVRIAIDDFGTGYSSMAYLTRLPVETLKIDRSFVRQLASSPENAAVVGAIIALGAGLGLRTIAEGVEIEEVAHRLREFGCWAGQGYLYSRPMSGEETAGYLMQRGRRTQTKQPAS